MELKDVKELLVMFTAVSSCLLLVFIILGIYTMKRVSLSHQDPGLEFKAVLYNNVLHNQLMQAVSCFCSLESSKCILFPIGKRYTCNIWEFYSVEDVRNEGNCPATCILVSIVHVTCFD